MKKSTTKDNPPIAVKLNRIVSGEELPVNSTVGVSLSSKPQNSKGELSKEFENIGVSEIVYTDIEKDGMMKGLNMDATLNLAKSVNIPIIASGGVSCLDDIRKMKPYVGSGISGIIIGRALYEKTITIKEAKNIFIL